MQAKKEPKTIEDWMHYAKELKLRIRKLEKKQADLVLKLSEPAYQSSATQSREKVVASAVSIHRSTVKIQKVWRGHRQRLKFKQELRRIANTNTSPGTSRPASNEVVIKGIFEVVKKQGLNLEMLFRACDKDMRGTIYLDDFKQFLRRLNLKLPLSKVNRFLHMLDEDCTGMIHRDEYLETLAAFSVNVERDNIKDHARTYEQECMLRFAGSLKKQGITPEEVCNFCDSTNGKTIRGIKLAKFAANMSDGFFEKEIKGLRTFFDADNTGFIDKEFFIQQMKKAQDLIDKEPSLGARVRSPERKTDLRASLAASSRSFKTTVSIEKEDMGEGDQSFQPSSFRKSNNAINKPSIKKEQSSPVIKC